MSREPPTPTAGSYPETAAAKSSGRAAQRSVWSYLPSQRPYAAGGSQTGGDSGGSGDGEGGATGEERGEEERRRRRAGDN